MDIFSSVLTAIHLMTSLHLENQSHTHIFTSENNLSSIFELDYVVPVKIASLLYSWFLLFHFDIFGKNTQVYDRRNSLCIVPYFIDIVGQVPRELKLLHRGKNLAFARAKDQQGKFF